MAVLPDRRHGHTSTDAPFRLTTLTTSIYQSISMASNPSSFPSLQPSTAQTRKNICYIHPVRNVPSCKICNPPFASSTTVGSGVLCFAHLYAASSCPTCRADVSREGRRQHGATTSRASKTTRVQRSTMGLAPAGQLGRINEPEAATGTREDAWGGTDEAQQEPSTVGRVGRPSTMSRLARALSCGR